MLYKIEDLAPDTFFKDSDAHDVLTYEITSPRDDVVIQEGTMCSSPPCTVWLDIVRNRSSVNEFALEVVAVDSAKAKSVVLSYKYRMSNPASQTYGTQQFATSFDFRAITVGNRVGVNHALTLAIVPEDPNGGFAFVHAYPAKLAKAAAAPTAGATPATLPTFDTVSTATNDAAGQVHNGRSTPPTPTPASAEETAEIDGSIYAYTVNTTGSVSSTNMLVVDTADAPTLNFRVDGVGTGTIEVGFHIWFDLDGGDEASTTEVVEGNRHTAKWHTAKETLTVAVEAVK
jgi:hypothetical protein